LQFVSLFFVTYMLYMVYNINKCTVVLSMYNLRGKGKAI